MNEIVSFRGELAKREKKGDLSTNVKSGNVTRIFGNNGVFYNPRESRDLILKVLRNYRWSKYFVNKIKPHVLVIFNDREYVCTIKGFNTYDKRHKYADRVNENGFYDWEMENSYTLKDIEEYTNINDFVYNRITIDAEQNSFDILCDQYTFTICHSLIKDRIESIPPEKVDNPYGDSIFNSLGRMFGKLFK